MHEVKLPNRVTKILTDDVDGTGDTVAKMLDNSGVRALYVTENRRFGTSEMDHIIEKIINGSQGDDLLFVRDVLNRCGVRIEVVVLSNHVQYDTKDVKGLARWMDVAVLWVLKP